MQYVTLGRSGLMVSRLCFGVLTIGPLQQHLPLERGAAVIRRALELGVNFLDTAESYRTYPYIRRALRGWAGEVVVASKSYAHTAEGMRRSVEEARRALDRDRIEVFLLHEQESELTLRGHRPALDYLLEARARGLVRAVGISTHTVPAALAAARMPELDVLHPLLNRAGIGIMGGSRAGMLEAIAQAAAAGLGVYAMKPLGGGHLLRHAAAALRWALGRPGVQAVAVGMQSEEEVEANVAVAEGRRVDAALAAALGRQERRLHVEDWCSGCGSCGERCRHNAIRVLDGRAVVEHDLCVRCGYCAAVCPEFCLKVL